MNSIYEHALKRFVSHCPLICAMDGYGYGYMGIVTSYGMGEMNGLTTVVCTIRMHNLYMYTTVVNPYPIRLSTVLTLTLISASTLSLA